MTLYFQIEPLDRPPPGGGTYLVVDLENGGNGQYAHHAHPDRTLRDAVAGDVIVHNRDRYRLLAVQRFRSECKDPWFETVTACLAWIDEWERENYEFHRRWWIENTPAGGRIPQRYAAETKPQRPAGSRL